jgi:thymidylate synthase
MHYLEETHPIKFLYKASKYILENGEKYGDIIECRNMYSKINNVKEDIETEKMHEIFIDIFGEERLEWAKKVTFMEPKKRYCSITDKKDNIYECLPKSEKKDSYWGRLIGKCGKFERNQIAHLIKRLEKKQNSKTLQMVVYGESDIWKEMGPPCCISINIAPRNGILNLTANFRSCAFSKAGYADMTAIYEMGRWLAEESGNKLGDIGLFTHSAHLRGKDGEMKKIKSFISKVEEMDINIE